jgi:hypothetical protein
MLVFRKLHLQSPGHTSQNVVDEWSVYEGPLMLSNKWLQKKSVTLSLPQPCSVVHLTLLRGFSIQTQLATGRVNIRTFAFAYRCRDSTLFQDD